MVRKIKNYLAKHKKAANAFVRKASRAHGEPFTFEFEGRVYLVRELPRKES